MTREKTSQALASMRSLLRHQADAAEESDAVGAAELLNSQKVSSSGACDAGEGAGEGERTTWL
jgi:hypothetical protein